VELTEIETAPENAGSAAKQAGSSLPFPLAKSEPSRGHDGSQGSPRRLADPIAKPPTFAELRRKLDAAIMAEQWEAVKAIRERIVQAEREEAGNVVAIGARRRLR
jgi:hypothetical protein